MTIIERILDCLEKQNKKMSELCTFIGIGTSTMATWKTRNTDPSAKYISRICDFLNVSVDWLLTGEGEMYKSNDDVQLKISDEEKLSLDKKFILLKYDELNETEKLKFLDFITSGTFKVPQCKFYNSVNSNEAEDETVADYELQQIES